MNSTLVYLLWAAALIYIFVRSKRVDRPTVGLLFSYWSSMALFHLFAEICYEIGGYESPIRAASRVGFQLSGFMIIGLLLGIFLFDYIASPSAKPSLRSFAAPSPQYLEKCNSVGNYLLIAGILFYVILFLGISTIPGSSAIIGSAANLLIIGICLKFWSLRKLGRHQRAWGSAALIFAYPIVTVVGSGFLSYGMAGMTVVGCFVVITVGIRWGLLPFFPVVCFLGLSLFVTYFKYRDEIRADVRQHRSLESRLSKAYTLIAGGWTWLDLNNLQHLDYLGRLDQNQLVGAAKNYLDRRAVDYAEGKTLTDAVQALVPRLIWKNKPRYAGSGKIVSTYTGITFDENTSVGVGQLLELLINYGIPAIVLGFGVVAYVLCWFDYEAGSALNQGQIPRFVYYFTAGIPLLIMQGNFAEIFPAVVGALVLAAGTFKIIAQFEDLDHLPSIPH